MSEKMVVGNEVPCSSCSYTSVKRVLWPIRSDTVLTPEIDRTAEMQRHIAHYDRY